MDKYYYLIRHLVNLGHTVEIGQLSICVLYNQFYGYKFQVDSENSKYPYSKMYKEKDLDEAVEKFCEIKRTLKI